jgi:hypothetical protein
MRVAVVLALHSAIRNLHSAIKMPTFLGLWGQIFILGLTAFAQTTSET